MQLSGVSMADPYLLPDYISSLVNTGYRDTKGRAYRPLTINPAARTLVLLNPGQSNSINVLPSANNPTNAASIDNFNIYDGAAYDLASTKLLGTQDAGNGAIVTSVADRLITNNRFDRVILVPMGISGTPIAVWANGGVLKDRVKVAMMRLAARGIVPGMTGVTFALLLMQGEADKSLGTPQAVWQAQFGEFKANALAAGFVGRMFVCQETWSLGTTGPTVRAAQAAVVDNVIVFSGGDLDTIDNTGRVDTTHFSNTGDGLASAIIVNAMHASGVPF
jgi:hypothetical protein